MTKYLDETLATELSPTHCCLHKNKANTSKSSQYEDKIMILLFVMIIFGVCDPDANSEKVWTEL